MWLIESNYPVLLFLLSVVLLNSIPNTRSDDDVKGKDLEVCNPKAFKELLTRLEALEEAVRGIISAQMYQPFSPSASRIMLERNPAMRSIFQSISSQNETCSMDNNNSTSSIEDGPTTSFSYKNSITEDTRMNQSENINTVQQLKGALKCSSLLDIHFADKPPTQASGVTNVSLQDDNKSVEIVWSPPLADCLPYFSGLWIRVHEVDQDPLSIPYLSISRKCLKADNGGTSYSIILPSSSEDECNFPFENLTECRSYKVEIIANYQSLRGIVPFRTEIVIPPAKGGNTTDLESLVSVSTNADALLLNWEDNSGCASRLTSINLSITPAGEPGDDENWEESRFLTISRQCIKQLSNKSNLFSLTVTANPCAPEWKPLDKCRKYKVEMESKYSSTWIGPKTSLEIFTSSSASYPIDPTESWKCPNEEHYYCPSQQQCRYYKEVCDGGNHCYSPNINSKGSPGYLDELYCDMNLDCSKGFKCRRQCLPLELVCDGKYDCFNGQDEGIQCRSFDSTLSSVPKNSTSGTRSDRLLRRSIVSISVNPNSIVWLHFERIDKQHTSYTNIKIYDGPYLTSPLLLSHTNGSLRPPSVRSSGSDLYVAMDSFQNQTHGVRIFYTTMDNPGYYFVQGCGGYINGQGVVKSPPHTYDFADDKCIWFIESRQEAGTVLLLLSSSTTYPNSMIVYDGTLGEMLYNHKNRDDKLKKAIYSFSNKMIVEFMIPSSEIVAPNELIHSWNVIDIYTPHCKEHLTEPSGTIKSVNYPASYPSGSYDCRWYIATAAGSKIRLLFASFDTLKAVDFVSVYDGWNLDSSPLMEKSGYVATPFIISSSSNQVLIRFTSDSSIFIAGNSGFLAVYSTV